MIARHSGWCLLLALSWVHVAAVPGIRAAELAASRGGGSTGSQILAGHSVHGEAFDDGPRQAAYLMGGTGKVRFAITAANARAQAFFDQGLGQLHGFWYWEAERSFRQVAALDPECAMAYWGMAAANVNNQQRATGFIREAVKRKSNTDRRERLYIEALAAYCEDLEKERRLSEADKKPEQASDTDGADEKPESESNKASDAAKKESEKQRKQKYLADLEAIVKEFSDDIEAKALLANQRWNWREAIPIEKPEEVDSVLDLVFQVEAMHPAHHYRIHLWDDIKAEQALESAKRVGQAAPRIAHMWHMAGHTYSKLHRYEDATWQQEASARVDHGYMFRDRVMPYQVHNYAHNNEWLARSLLHVGRVQDAIEVAKNLRELPRHPKLNSADTKDSAASFGRERLFDALVLYERWDDYVRLADTDYLAFGEKPSDEIKRRRWLGVAHFSMRNQVQGGEQLAALQNTLAGVKKEQDDAGERAAAKAGEEANAEEAIKKSVDEARKSFDERVQAAENGIAHLQGLKALAVGDAKQGIELLKRADDVKKPHLARAHSLAGEHELAIELANKAVEDGKGEVFPAAVQLEVLYRAGKIEDAKQALATLRAMSNSIDGRSPVFDRVSEISASLGQSGDWRLTQETTSDRGLWQVPQRVFRDLERLSAGGSPERPPLETLGPLRWQPAPAYDFSLPDAHGNVVSLRLEYARRPVVLLFYLGHGCPHCIAQLNAFAPLARTFQEAGIAVVAISTDGVADLWSSVEAIRSHGEPAIRFVSDQSLAVFKAYRAYDDFEATPLHGTFLLDHQALIRWQDIGAEPFTDASFLLTEAKRLLALPK